MSVKVNAERRASRGGLKEPTGRDYLAFYGLGVAGVLVLGMLASVLDWSRYVFVLSGFAWAAIYGPIGVIVLRGRRQTPMPTRS